MTKNVGFQVFNFDIFHQFSYILVCEQSEHYAQCLKMTQNVAFEFFNFDTFRHFLSPKSDLSGNTVWPQASVFQKLAKMAIFGFF